MAVQFGGATSINVNNGPGSSAVNIQDGGNIISVENAQADILGVDVVGSRNNQIEISFETSFNADLITNATTSTGSATISNGHALYATGTGTTASATGTSLASVLYRPAHEQYAYFTAAFTTPTSANSNQRIGLYDTNNGFFIGYQGTSFGITRRSAGVDTFTAKSSWNGDQLTGATGSKFSRNGTPEAINFTFSNLFRIRFAWLGSASIILDVFSPDGNWVTCHTIKQPNSALNPSIVNPNLPMKIEALKSSADATNLIIYTACWAGGTTSSYSRLTETLNDYSLAALNRSVIVGRASTGGGTYYNVKVTPSGAMSIDGTVAATQSGTWNINNITGTVTLPTGAATETTLAAISTKTPALGQATMANSSPVVIASNQSTLTIRDITCTGAAPGTVTIGTSSTSTGISAGTYQKLIFCNISANTISLAFDTAAIANRGIVLNRGEKVILDGPFVITAINAIASGAGSALTFQTFA